MTIKAPHHHNGLLGNFWAKYFPEVPLCTSEGCAEIASDVDPFFPYLDDLNRCPRHRSVGTFELASGSLS